jgi:hypothetical protein
MRVRVARGVVVGVVLGWLCLCAPGRALADVRVVTLDGRSFPDVVAGFQADLHSLGRSVQLCVRDESGACVPCGSYTLSFDEVGAQAFAMSACDERSRSTLVTLRDRGVLFDHSHAIPRPRAITLRAEIVRAIETTGGAASTGGSSVGCTARVRPYLRDLEHGTNVPLGPDEYDVRVTHAGVEVTMIGNGWMLVSETQIASDVDYDVIERASGESVMRGHASLECASETTTSDGGVVSVTDAAIAGHGFAPITTLTGVAGATGARTSGRAGCAGYYTARPQHVLTVENDVGSVEIRAFAVPNGDLTLAVRTSDGMWHCNDDGGRAPNALDPIVALSASPHGRVEVWVGTFGPYAEIEYRLDVREHDADAPPSRPLRARRDGSLLAAGVVVSAVSWAFMTVFDLAPDIVCTSPHDCPNGTWTSLAWIPFFGPWIADAAHGASSGGLDAFSTIDTVIQDLGFVVTLAGLLVLDEPSVPLTDQPSAPRLSLGGGPGTAIGATITF